MSFDVDNLSSEKQQNRLLKALKHNQALTRDPLIDRALAELELVKKSSKLVSAS